MSHGSWNSIMGGIKVDSLRDSKVVSLQFRSAEILVAPSPGEEGISHVGSWKNPKVLDMVSIDNLYIQKSWKSLNSCRQLWYIVTATKLTSKLMNGFYKKTTRNQKTKIHCSTPLVTCQHANVGRPFKSSKIRAVVASGAWKVKIWDPQMEETRVRSNDFPFHLG